MTHLVGARFDSPASAGALLCVFSRDADRAGATEFASSATLASSAVARCETPPLAPIVGIGGGEVSVALALGETTASTRATYASAPAPWITAAAPFDGAAEGGTVVVVAVGGAVEAVNRRRREASDSDSGSGSGSGSDASARAAGACGFGVVGPVATRARRAAARWNASRPRARRRASSHFASRFATVSTRRVPLARPGLPFASSPTSPRNARSLSSSRFRRRRASSGGASSRPAARRPRASSTATSKRHSSRRHSSRRRSSARRSRVGTTRSRRHFTRATFRATVGGAASRRASRPAAPRDSSPSPSPAPNRFAASISSRRGTSRRSYRRYLRSRWTPPRVV